jgi:phenylpyruvate tautomerase PptA (4-oxalocrotonate tautomerase family)
MNKKSRFVIFALVLIAGIFLAGCGPVPAGAEIKVNPDGLSAQVEFSGIVDSIAADLWVVAGQSLVISPLTNLDPAIIAGDLVEVHATATLDGTVNADSIKLFTPEHPATPGGDKETEFVGVVESIDPESWVVSGVTFVITLQTEIKGPIIVGDRVKIEALVGTDGTRTALEIKLADEKNDSDEKGSESEFSGIVESISPDSWTVGGQVFAITEHTEIEGTILVSDLVKIEAVVATDGTITAREIKLVEDESTSSNDESKVEFTGVVESISLESWTVDGQVIAITSQTEIKGTFIAGDTVSVEAVNNPDGTLTALEIKDSGDHGSSSHDSENDDHSSHPADGRSSDDDSEHGGNYGGGYSSEGDD